jgi:hypothetical protein
MKLPASHALVAAALTLATLTAAPGAQAARSSGDGWTTMELPSDVTRPAVLNSIAVASRDLAWAVGTEDASGAGGPLLLDWNGKHWSKDAVPGKPRVGQMVQVSSATPETAWALGYIGAGGTNFVLRWRRNAWVQVPVPGVLKSQTVYSIAAGTAGTAWLYGYSDSRGYLLERWSAGHWQTIKVPVDLWGDVEDMVAVGARDLWLNDYNDEGNSVIVHYNAGHWTATQPAPGGATFISDFLPVTARSVWVTGWVCTTVEPGEGCITVEPLIAHWNGSSWNQVLHPKGAAYITSISPGRSGQPLWAGVGASGAREPFFYAHFSGKAWSLEHAGPAMRGIVATNTMVAAVPGTNATWAVTNRQSNALAPGITAIAYNAGR